MIDKVLSLRRSARFTYWNRFQRKQGETGNEKTSVLIYTEYKPGALFRILEPFEKLQINLTKIETRPSKNQAWAYVFFIDFEGHTEDTQVQGLFKRLDTCTAEIKILGSYPISQSECISILIIGLGLIGGSIARGLKQANPNQAIAGIDKNTETIALAMNEGVIDQTGELDALCMGSDIVILALPPKTAIETIPHIAACTGPETVVTDVSSVKSAIIESVNKLDQSFAKRFIAGHPIAGSEQSGYEASTDNLFYHRSVIITPQLNNDPGAVSLINALWRQLGSFVLGLRRITAGGTIIR